MVVLSYNFMLTTKHNVHKHELSSLEHISFWARERNLRLNANTSK